MTSQPQSPQFRFDLFLSYAREQEVHARLAYHALVAAGWRVYFSVYDSELNDKDEDKDVESVLSDRLKDSASLLVLLDPSHLAAEWCGWEIAAFRAMRPNGIVYFQSIDFTQPIHVPSLTPWRTETIDAECCPREVSDSGLSLIFYPSKWFALLRYSESGFRLFDHLQPVTRGELVARPQPARSLWGSRGVLSLLVMYAATLALTARLAWDTAQAMRQLGLIAAVSVGAGLATAILQDVVVALVAATGSLFGAVVATQLYALAHAEAGRIAWDAFVAGGSVTGTFVGLAVSVRLAQTGRCPRRRWNWKENQWFSYIGEVIRLWIRGALSITVVLVVGGLLFRQARLAEYLPELRTPVRALGSSSIESLTSSGATSRLVSAPLIAGLAFAVFLTIVFLRSSLLSKQPRWQLLPWCLAPVVVSLVLARWELSIGTNAGLLTGTAAAITVGRSRIRTTRGRLVFQPVWRAALGVLVVFVLIGWSSSRYRFENSQSAAYGFTTGLLVALLLTLSYCFHGTLWSTSERPGYDAVFGGIATLLLLPRLGYVVIEFERWLENHSGTPGGRVFCPEGGLPSRGYWVFYTCALLSFLGYQLWRRPWMTRRLSYSLGLSLLMHVGLYVWLVRDARDGGSPGAPALASAGGRLVTVGVQAPIGDSASGPARPSPPQMPTSPAERWPIFLPKVHRSRVPAQTSDSANGQFRVVSSAQQQLRKSARVLNEIESSLSNIEATERSIFELTQQITLEARRFAASQVGSLETAAGRAGQALLDARAALKASREERHELEQSPPGVRDVEHMGKIQQGAERATSAKERAERALDEAKAALDEVGHEIERKRAARNNARARLRGAGGSSTGSGSGDGAPGSGSGFGSGPGYRINFTSDGFTVHVAPGAQVRMKYIKNASNPVHVRKDTGVDWSSDVVLTESATIHVDNSNHGSKKNGTTGPEVRTSNSSFGYEDANDGDFDEPQFYFDELKDNWSSDDPCLYKGETGVGDTKKTPDDPGCPVN